MKTLMFIVLFLCIGGFYIISNEGIALNSGENINLFFNLYGEWISSLTDQAGSFTGYMVKMEWLPENGVA